MEDTSAKNN